MNSISVTGKDWILKKFDQSKIVYLKENYSIDEITAKLLVIRNIKLEDIKSFLNPSIKNYLPNVLLTKVIYIKNSSNKKFQTNIKIKLMWRLYIKI